MTWTKEKHREYCREWRKKNREKCRVSENRSYLNGGREKSNEYYHSTKEIWREKYIARARVRNAIKSGKLIRPKECSKCKRDCKPEAHHVNYSQPLQVEWLCRICHTD